MKQCYPGKWLLAILAITFTTTLQSQTFKLLKDINAQTNSNPSNVANNSTSYAVLNGKAYFAADDGIHGKELWCSDGTTAGTKMVKDIVPGTGSSNINPVYVYNGKLYFFTTTSQFSQLYISDGTEAGTVILKDSFGVTGVAPFTNPSFAEWGGVLYFTASNNGNFEELWRTDGTWVGTKQIANFNSSKYGYVSNIKNLILYRDRLYFTTGFGDGQLWYTDGTIGGVKKYIPSNIELSYISKLAIVNDTLYAFGFQAIWQTTGNDQVKQVNTDYHGATDIGSTKKNLFCTLYGLTYGSNTNAIGVYKYAPLGSHDLSLIIKATNAQLITVQNADDSLYYFLAKDSTDARMGLWVTGGTAKNTIKLLSDSNQFSNFFVINKKLYFSHKGNNSGEELWVTDGSIAGTKMVSDINPGAYNASPSNFTQFNQGLLFAANTNANGIELWKTDGTSVGTSLVKDINVTTTASSWLNLSKSLWDTINNKLVYWADDGLHGYELWATDNRDNSATILKDIFPGPTSSQVYNPSVTRFKNNAYFFAGLPGNNYTLWKTQGTPGSTIIVSPEISAPQFFQSNSISTSYIGTTSNYLFTIITKQISNASLYAYNGTGEPLLLKEAFTPIPAHFQQTPLYSAGNNIYFQIQSKTGSSELWKSNGTIAGTSFVKEIYPSSYYSSYGIECKGQLFFIANNASSNSMYNYLWKSDGTESGTIPLAKIVEQLPNGYPLVTSNNNVYFVAYEDNTGLELWTTDGTTNGTHIVKDIVQGKGNSNISSMADLNGVLYFTANDGNGPALWKTDGTTGGTKLIVKVITPYVHLLTANNKLYFIDANKIWQSDGTAGGTHEIDATGLAGITGIADLNYANGNLFFTGTSYAYGNELYTTTKSLLPVTLLNFKGRLQGNNGVLQWATVNEQNNEYFAIQRSTNGVSFVNVGRVNAKQGIKENNYDFTDLNITSLNVSKVYYRLQQFDLDGKFTYSNTIALDVDNSNLLRVGPNPAVGYTNLYSSINIANAIITLTDINGHILYTAKQNITAGSKITIPLTGFAAGVYTVTVQSPGITKQEFKLVVSQ